LLLVHEDLLDLCDDSRIGVGEDWYPEIEDAMKRASVAVLLVSADFLTSKFILSKEVPPLLERREKEGLKIFPMIIRPCAWDEVKWLARMQIRPKGETLSAGNDHQIDTELVVITKEIKSIIGRCDHAELRGEFVPLPPEKISLAKLPSTNPELFGREKELTLLDNTWANPKTNIICFVAWGGMGKTALVNSSWTGLSRYRRPRMSQARSKIRLFQPLCASLLTIIGGCAS
jgi:hypothetical protein